MYTTASKNKHEQANIRRAVIDAIPEDVYYFNVVMALTELLSRFTELCFADELQTLDPDDLHKIEKQA